MSLFIFLWKAYFNCMSELYTFIDLFAGIGGFHLAFSRLGCQCVFASENNDKARQTYQANYSIENFAGDINYVNPKDIPDHDILCAGFPCQPFSIAGLRKGFQDVRGNFFDVIMSIVREKRPRAFFLENVRHLRRHDKGRTFAIIEASIQKAGYSFFPYLVYAKDYGVPQMRPRMFMLGFRDLNNFVPPPQKKLELTMSHILGGKCTREVGYTLRVGGAGSGINDSHNWDSYIVDGKVVRLTLKQAMQMQGFPADFVFPVSRAQAMKQLGNSVAVPAVQAYARAILDTLTESDKVDSVYV